MLKLPFKTFPQKFEKVTVGNPEIGELELPKYGDISPNERLFIKAANLTDIRLAAVKLAKDIAVKSGKQVIDIYNALTQGDSESLAEYLEEFVSFQDLMDDAAMQRSLVLATAVIQRLVPDWKLENTGDPNQLHPQLLTLIIEFAKNEEAGWPTSVTQVTDSEALASLRASEDLGNSTPNSEILTGEKSTGESEDTGHKKNGSVKKALETSQPG
ncbi:hypothetical protein NIES4072_31440 [Nostoc commune NIES-4072]|uniref:Uncharacterized protein n=1 Tax=Nostoc commune NIES-4072 TaxID=2005467 RepID=A0A2R5FL17_NOSCO|nr:hypothetical protein [Nostoc commune]BBD69523.1 hypothetical protein NIES4070_59320 [Nostoc commune HK-02]GBG19476.1 hypothetical protein NIES4072_31440 [Nostoc commune NIES-4072]